MGNTVKPFLNISTGDMIRRELEFLGWTQEDLAQVTNISRKTLSNIMNAKQKLQMEHARALAEALGGSAESWMHIDTRYWLNATGPKRRTFTNGEKSPNTKVYTRFGDAKKGLV
jgi:addiction module HigA family antidote